LFSNRLKSLLFLLLLFTFLVFGAQSAESSGKTVMHLGSFKLTSLPAILANNSSINNSSLSSTYLNNISANKLAVNSSSMSEVPIKNLSIGGKKMDTSVPAVPVVDLSNYAKDRKNKTLAGYKNIMYPMGESRGPPGAAGGGGGGGCGCGG
jgi:hypothetical protein